MRAMVLRSGLLRVGVTGDRRRVGVPWLAWTCGVCEFCERGEENLCDRARFTGYTRDGRYAEYVVADERFCFAMPEDYTAAEAAPLLCAGLIGFRAGGSRRSPPRPLDAAVVFAPAGPLVVAALTHVRKGGTVRVTAFTGTAVLTP